MTCLDWKKLRIRESWNEINSPQSINLALGFSDPEIQIVMCEPHIFWGLSSMIRE